MNIIHWTVLAAIWALIIAAITAVLLLGLVCSRTGKRRE